MQTALHTGLDRIQRLLEDECDAFKANYEKIRDTPNYPDNDSKHILSQYKETFKLGLQKIQEAITQSEEIANDIDDPSKQHLLVEPHSYGTVCTMLQEGRTSGGRYSTPNISIGRYDSSDDVKIEEEISTEFGPGGHTYIILATKENAAILHHVYALLLRRKLNLVDEYFSVNPHDRRSAVKPQQYEDKKFFSVPRIDSSPRLDSWIIPKGKPFSRAVAKKNLVYIAQFDMA